MITTLKTGFDELQPAAKKKKVSCRPIFSRLYSIMLLPIHIVVNFTVNFLIQKAMLFTSCLVNCEKLYYFTKVSSLKIISISLLAWPKKHHEEVDRVTAYWLEWAQIIEKKMKRRVECMNIDSSIVVLEERAAKHSIYPHSIGCKSPV